MPKVAYVALGSNTTVKTGEGTVYGLLTSGANGGSVFLVDSVSIGVTPNYVTLPQSAPSNIANIGVLTAAPFAASLYGSHFYDGLTVAATSNANVTVFYD